MDKTIKCSLLHSAILGISELMLMMIYLVIRKT